MTPNPYCELFTR